MNAQVKLPEIESGSPAALLPLELEWVLAGFRLRAQRRKAWLQNIWHIAETESNPTLELADADAPAKEEEWVREALAAQHLTEQIAAVDKALAAQSETRLFLIRRVFGLSAEDFDLLQACLALALDPSLARSCAGAELDPDDRRDIATRLRAVLREFAGTPEHTSIGDLDVAEDRELFEIIDQIN